MNKVAFKSISSSIRANVVSYTLRTLNSYLLECEVRQWLRTSKRENWLELRNRWATGDGGRTEAFRLTCFVGKYAKFKR